MHIRNATLRDANAMAACIDAAYARYGGVIADLPDVSGECAEAISTDQVWVGEDVRGEIIAVLVLAGASDDDGQSFMKIVNLAIHPAHGGKGIARKLMAIAEREARAQGFGEMRLNTHEALPENVQIYTHLGWQIIPAPNARTISMCKTLAPH